MFLIGNNEPQGIISQELLEKAASAVGRSVEVPVFDSETVTIGSTRTAVIADSENTSQLYTVSFTTYAWGFTIIPSLFMNNEMSIQDDFNRKFEKYLFQFAADVDNQCISALSAAKSQVFANTLIYTNTANTLVAANADKDRILGHLTAIMNANDYYGPEFRILANSGLQAQIMDMAEHGKFNDQDKTIQWQDKTFHYSNRLLDSVGHESSGYCVNPGSLGMLFRHEREALLGTILPDGHEWQRDMLPMVGIPIDTYFYYGVGDYSAIAGASSADMTRVAKEHHGFAIEIATVTAYNTDLATYAAPIVRFAVAE